MAPVQLNPDIIGLKESSTLWINQKVKSLRAEGHDVVHFGFGQSPFPVHSSIVKALQDHSHQKDYLPTMGLYELRDHIAKYYKAQFAYDLDPNYILVGPGSKELIFQALFVLEGPVIIPAPSWVSYGPQVNVRGKHITRALTRREDGYKLTPEGLQTVCTTLPEGQKILIINSPNNPTGAVYSQGEIEGIVSVCTDNNVVIISDEIYGLIDFTDEKKRGFYYYYPDRTVITAGLSKSHSAGGYRMGFLATSSGMGDAVKCLSSLVSETFSAVSAPIQNAAIKAYSLDKDLMDYVDLCTSIHKSASGYLYRRLKGMGLLLPEPQGAFYLFPDFENHKEMLNAKGIVTSTELASALLEEADVALLPGTDFYCPPSHLACRVASVDYDGEEVVRVAARVKNIDEKFIDENCPNLKKGCDRIEQFLSQK